MYSVIPDLFRDRLLRKAPGLKAWAFFITNNTEKKNLDKVSVLDKNSIFGLKQKACNTYVMDNFNLLDHCRGYYQ